MPDQSRPGFGGIWSWLPWVAYFVVGNMGYRPVGAFVALAAATYPVVRARNSGSSIKMPDAAAAIFFAMASAAIAIGGSTGAWFWKYNFVIVWAVFTAGAWGSILVGSPFTIAFARESTPPEVWEAPLFRKTNLIITTVWALMFTVNLIAMLLIVGATGFGAWIPLIGPTLTMGVAIVFTTRYAAYVQRVAATSPST